MKLRLIHVRLIDGPGAGEVEAVLIRSPLGAFLYRDADGDPHLYTPVDESDPFDPHFAYVGNGDAESLCDLGLAEPVEAPAGPAPAWRECELAGGPADGCRFFAEADKAPAGVVEVETAAGVVLYRMERPDRYAILARTATPAAGR